MIVDLTSMLDCVDLDLAAVNDSYQRYDLAKLRWSLYCWLVECCQEVGYDSVPPSEKGTLGALLPQSRKEESPLTGLVSLGRKSIRLPVKPDSVRGRTERDDCRAILRMMELFPECAQISWLALLDLRLISLGLEPVTISVPPSPLSKIRHIEWNPPEGETGQDPVKVLVVDDNPLDILSTIRPLLGLLGVEISVLLVSTDDDSAVDAAYERLATEIIGRRADLVLMDQCLGHLGHLGFGGEILGSKLVSKVGDQVDDLGPGPNPVMLFVANTGGPSEELNRVGAIGNYDKGRNPGCLIDGLNAVMWYR